VDESRSLTAHLDDLAALRGLARSLLRDAALADDVVQEASLAAVRRNESERDGRLGPATRGYWASVVRHLAAKFTRAAHRRVERERAAARTESLPSTDQVAQRLALNRALLGSIEALPPPLRDVVIRRWFDRQKPQRIAQELGVPLATVKTRLQRALARLRGQLRDEWGDDALAGLVLLARPSMPTSLAAPTTGAIVMATKLKSAVLAGIAVALLVGTWKWTHDGRETPPARTETRESATAAVDHSRGATPEPARTTELPRAAPKPARAEDPRRFASLRGIVIGPDGRPFAGARVDLVRKVAGDLPLHPFLRSGLAEKRVSTTSAADGTFEFADVRRGLASSLEASAPPDLLGRTPAGILAGDPATITLEHQASLRGVVRETSGTPVGDATMTVGLVGSENLELLRRAATDASGRFTIDGLLPGPVNVRAFTPAGDFPTPQRVELREGGATELEIVVGDAVAIEGVVLDADDDTPVAGARLFESFYSGTEPVAVTDEAGRFRIRSASPWPSNVLMFVQARGYGVRDFVAPAPSTSTSTIEVRLVAGRAIRGRVLDPDGAPAVDAVVAVICGQTLANRTLHLSNEQLVTRSRADGTFVLADVDPKADHLLQLHHEECADFELEVLGDENKRGDLDLGDLQLRRGAMVSGCVVDEHDQPVPHARIEIAPDDAPPVELHARFRAQFFAHSRQRETVTRRDGSFAFGSVTPGRWTARARLFGRSGDQAATFEVTGDEVLEDVRIVMTESFSISGRVVDSEGRVVPGVWVEARRSWASIGTRRAVPGDVAARDATVDQQPAGTDGTFRLSGLDAGTYRVVASVPGRQSDRPRAFAPATIDSVSAGTTDLALVMKDAVPIAGCVMRADGSAAAGADVIAHDDAGAEMPRIECDLSGRFELLVAKGTTWRLEVFGPIETPDSFEVPAPPRPKRASDRKPDVIVQDVAAGRTDVTVRLPGSTE
jgi:RNA polymerase sigma-70 factor (ECF subfamily)